MHGTTKHNDYLLNKENSRRNLLSDSSYGSLFSYSGQRHVQLKTVHYSHYLMTEVFQISSLSLVSLGKPDTSSQPIRFNLPPIGLDHSRFLALLVVCLYPLRALIGVPEVFHSGSSGCCVLFCSFF